MLRLFERTVATCAWRMLSGFVRPAAPGGKRRTHCSVCMWCSQPAKPDFSPDAIHFGKLPVLCLWVPWWNPPQVNRCPTSWICREEKKRARSGHKKAKNSCTFSYEFWSIRFLSHQFFFFLVKPEAEPSVKDHHKTLSDFLWYVLNGEWSLLPSPYGRHDTSYRELWHILQTIFPRRKALKSIWLDKQISLSVCPQNLLQSSDSLRQRWFPNSIIQESP